MSFAAVTGWELQCVKIEASNRSMNILACTGKESLICITVCLIILKGKTKKHAKSENSSDMTQPKRLYDTYVYVGDVVISFFFLRPLEGAPVDMSRTTGPFVSIWGTADRPELPGIRWMKRTGRRLLSRSKWFNKIEKKRTTPLPMHGPWQGEW